METTPVFLNWSLPRSGNAVDAAKAAGIESSPIGARLGAENMDLKNGKNRSRVQEIKMA